MPAVRSDIKSSDLRSDDSSFRLHDPANRRSQNPSFDGLDAVRLNYVGMDPVVSRPTAQSTEPECTVLPLEARDPMRRDVAFVFSLDDRLFRAD